MRRSLTELEGEVRTTRHGERRVPTLWFLCPCGGHHHAMPFGPSSETLELAGGGRLLVWALGGEATIERITLRPSYVGQTTVGEERCRLHAFVTEGQLEILGDSELAGG